MNKKEVEEAVNNVKHVSNLLNEGGLANIEYYDNLKIIIDIAELWIARKEIEKTILNSSLLKFEKLLLQIYKFDKTPEYAYGQTKKCQTEEGEVPNKGARWQTPREIIRAYFNESFWEEWNKFCEREERIKGEK